MSSIDVRLLGPRLGSAGGERYVTVTDGSDAPEGWLGLMSESSLGSLLPGLPGARERGDELTLAQS